MSKEEKRIRLFDLIDNPDKYSDEEIEKLLSDDEARKSYEVLASAKHAFARENTFIEDLNIDNEWAIFRANHRRGNWLKIVVSIIAAVMLSGMAFAFAVHFNIIPLKSNEPSTNRAETVKVEKDNVNVETKDKNSLIEKKDTTQVYTVTFKNVSLEGILQQMAKYYSLEVDINDEEMLAVRLYFVWDKNKSIEDNIQLLNGFDRISLSLNDNTITMTK